MMGTPFEIRCASKSMRYRASEVSVPFPHPIKLQNGQKVAWRFLVVGRFAFPGASAIVLPCLTLKRPGVRKPSALDATGAEDYGVFRPARYIRRADEDRPDCNLEAEDRSGQHFLGFSLVGGCLLRVPEVGIRFLKLACTRKASACADIRAVLGCQPLRLGAFVSIFAGWSWMESFGSDSKVNGGALLLTLMTSGAMCGPFGC